MALSTACNQQERHRPPPTKQVLRAHPPSLPDDPPRVDPKHAFVEVHAQRIVLVVPGAFTDAITWAPADACPPLRARLAALKRGPDDQAIRLVGDADLTYGQLLDMMKCVRGDANELFPDVRVEMAR